jgi:hypothetical protein
LPLVLALACVLRPRMQLLLFLGTGIPAVREASCFHL